MNLKASVVLFTLCFAFSLRADVVMPDSIVVPPGSQFTTDNMGNLYVYTPTNDIVKYNPEGVKMATANFKVLGNISSIDAGNPFEIYVFYRDQNKVVFLDNLLNIRGECDMESIGVSQIACIARSSDNQIWLFDMADQKLKKYSKDLKLIIESAALNNFPVGNNINPTMILDINSSVLVLNNNRILEFDLFANFNKTLIADTMATFQYLNGNIIYFKNGQVQMFNPLSFKMDVLSLNLPEKTLQVRLEKERLFILKDEFVILRFIPE